jgi:hypothetical protein
MTAHTVGKCFSSKTSGTSSRRAPDLIQVLSVILILITIVLNLTFQYGQPPAAVGRVCGLAQGEVPFIITINDSIIVIIIIKRAAPVSDEAVKEQIVAGECD